MSQALRIGIVGGSGWLGGAIAGALLNAGVVREENLFLSYRSRKPDRFRGAVWTADNRSLVDRCDVIIVSVRRADWPSLTLDCTGKLALSVMAGIPLDDLAAQLGTTRIVRSLPNAAAEAGVSYTPWIAGTGIGEGDRMIVRAIFDACGVQDKFASERDIDYLTGLSGSGPAFPALLAAAMFNDAVARGLPPQIAWRAVNAVLVGTGRLLDRREEHPRDVVQAFLDHKGTTAAAIEAMRARGFDAAVAAGLAAAFDRSTATGGASPQ